LLHINFIPVFALSAAATVIFAMLIVYAMYLDRREKLTLLTLLRKLPAQDQLLVKAIENIKKPQNVTTQAITTEFQKLSATPISEAFVFLPTGVSYRNS
jgi:hypothetical protein